MPVEPKVTPRDIIQAISTYLSEYWGDLDREVKLVIFLALFVWLSIGIWVIFR
jgi:hypothetical protein